MGERLDFDPLLWAGMLALSCACTTGYQALAPETTVAQPAPDAGQAAQSDPLQHELDRLESNVNEEREAAARQLAQFPQPKAREGLEARLAREEDEGVREAIQRSLTKTEP